MCYTNMRFSLKNANWQFSVGQCGSVYVNSETISQSDFYILAYILLAPWYDGTIEIALNFVVLC